MAEKQLVLSFFADEPTADAAARALKDSEVNSGNAIGILIPDAAKGAMAMPVERVVPMTARPEMERR